MANDHIALVERASYHIRAIPNSHETGLLLIELSGAITDLTARLERYELIVKATRQYLMARSVSECTDAAMKVGYAIAALDKTEMTA